MATQAIQHFRMRELQPLLKTSSALKPLVATPKLPNPFLPRKNLETGRWAPSKYSLRQQSDLVKAARRSNLVHLLPPGPKLPLAELQKARELAFSVAGSGDVVEGPSSEEGRFLIQEIVWEGEFKERAVPGAGIGNKLYAGKRRMFKGHKWERTKEKREKKRKILLESMPARIQRFRTVYKRKRPNPLSVPLASKSSKLPF